MNLILKTKKLTFFQKLLQVYWIIPNRWLLESFELNNGILTIKTKNGKKLESPLKDIESKHLIDRNENKVFYITAKNGEKINFREVLWTLEEDEWQQIFNILDPKETGLSKVTSIVNDVKEIVDKIK